MCGCAPKSLCSTKPSDIFHHARCREILENPKLPGSGEDGPTRDRLDPAPCVLQVDREMLVVGLPRDAAKAHPKAGGGDNPEAVSPLPGPSSRRKQSWPGDRCSPAPAAR